MEETPNANPPSRNSPTLFHRASFLKLKRKDSKLKETAIQSALLELNEKSLHKGSIPETGGGTVGGGGENVVHYGEEPPSGKRNESDVGDIVIKILAKTHN